MCLLDTETGNIVDRTYPLWSVEDSFAIADVKDLTQSTKVDVTDILNELTKHTVVGGNIEDKIMCLNIDNKYKDKALELLNG